MDYQSYRTAIEMGYEIHDDGMWWPTYDFNHYDASDWKDYNWRVHIHRQWQRLGVKLYCSPDNTREKRLSLARAD